MSSRSESKEAARQARIAAEAEAAAATRRQRIWALLGGSVLLAAIVVVILIVISAGGSGSDEEASGDVAHLRRRPAEGDRARRPESAGDAGRVRRSSMPLLPGIHG